MATAFRTVADEMALTNWSPAADSPRVGTAPSTRSNLLSIVAVALVGVAVVLSLFHLLPAGSY